MSSLTARSPAAAVASAASVQPESMSAFFLYASSLSLSGLTSPLRRRLTESFEPSQSSTASPFDEYASKTK